MIDQQIDIATKDGKTTTFITHPERGGPFPVIIFYMDAPAIREELRDMARRLGTSGYYVMLPNITAPASWSWGRSRPTRRHPSASGCSAS